MAVAEARRPHWYVDGEVLDTVEGRFAVLASVLALMVVRVEREGKAGTLASVALTERFVETMDAEIRQMGVSDPAIGKQVRRLVGALAARVEGFRDAIDDERWIAAVERGIYPGRAPSPSALAHSSGMLRHLQSRLDGSALADLEHGKFA